MEKNYVLKGDICYSKDPVQLHTLKDSYLVCHNGSSAGIFAELPKQYADFPQYDYTGQMIIPGLVDLHVHAPQHTFCGLGMDLELLDWLNAYTFPQEAKYKELAYARKAYAAFVKEVQKGPNTRAVVFATAHVPATLLLMDMLEESGLVTLVGKVNMDRNSHADLQEKSAADSLNDTVKWLEECQGRYHHTQPILTPRFIPSCSDELLEGLAELQEKYGLPVQSHLSENLGEIEWVKELCPEAESYGDAYHRFGLFGGKVPTIMAHCVWLQPKDIELMREKGVFAAHCPQSNMNLSSGIAPVRRYLNEGIKSGLGSDVAGGCQTSIFRAMADAVQVSKLRWRLVDESEEPLTLAEAFFLGTKGGGSFFGKVGSFEEGYEFDALVIDDSSFAPPETLALEDRLARIVYLSDDRHITAKFVRGTKV